MAFLTTKESNLFFLVTKFQCFPLKILSMVLIPSFLDRCTEGPKFDKKAWILVQNVPQPSKMFPGGAGTFSHV